MPGTAAQQAFISLVAPGAIAAQQRYGIPAAVTIAQAIDESGWGQSALATADHNLFGIKGTPAGRDMLPTREYENGAWVTRTAPFRVYHNIAESIEDHGRLLATGPAYQHAMASRHLPDAFATALTGVYATDPGYGSNLIALMRLYNLYRYDPRRRLPPRRRAAAAGPGGPRASRRWCRASRTRGVRRAGQAFRGWRERWPSARCGQARHGIPERRQACRRPARCGRRAPGRSGAAGAGGGRPGPGRRPGPRIAPRGPLPKPRRYVPRIPYPVAADFAARAKGPLTRAQPLYQDVASRTGIGWELLAACDWMQCQARPRYSPVHGEKLGTVNPDGTVFRTRSAALAQCASDLIELADAVYQIGLPAAAGPVGAGAGQRVRRVPVGRAAQGARLSAMEFPYSVAGLTVQHLKMRWPDIDEPYAPDKPGARFRMPFGAVPVVLSLGYRAVA